MPASQEMPRLESDSSCLCPRSCPRSCPRCPPPSSPDPSPLLPAEGEAGSPRPCQPEHDAAEATPRRWLQQAVCGLLHAEQVPPVGPPGGGCSAGSPAPPWRLEDSRDPQGCAPPCTPDHLPPPPYPHTVPLHISIDGRCLWAVPALGTLGAALAWGPGWAGGAGWAPKPLGPVPIPAKCVRCVAWPPWAPWGDRATSPGARLPRAPAPWRGQLDLNF